MIRPDDDIDRIMAVMETAFAPQYGEAWSRRQVEDALLIGTCHYGLINANGSAPELGEAAVGFFLSRTGFDEEELLLLAVAPPHRGCGLGARLLDSFARDAWGRGSTRLLLEMRRGNPAELLYRNYGFTPIGERRDYYRTADGARIDAITFACERPS